MIQVPNKILLEWVESEVCIALSNIRYIDDNNKVIDILIGLQHMLTNIIKMNGFIGDEKDE